MALDVPLDLILAEPEWEVELEGVVVLTALGLLEAGLVRCCGP